MVSAEPHLRELAEVRHVSSDNGAKDLRAPSKTDPGVAGRRGPGDQVAAGTPIGAMDPRGQWTLVAAVLALALGALLGMFWPTAWSMVSTWWGSRSFGHGFLILPICGYLIWRRRLELARTPPRPCVWGLAVIAVAAFAWLTGSLASAQSIQQFAFVAIIQGFVLTILGTRTTRIISFPLLYLFFAVPVGTFLIAPLQDFTAQFLVRMLWLSGIPVYLDGIFLQIPTASFEVAEACAGLRFLTTTIALGMIVAYSFYRQFWRRLLFIALSVVVPVVANGFRAYGIVMVAHYVDPESAAGADHITYGLIFLSIVFACLLGLGTLFRERGPGLSLSSTVAFGARPSGPAPAALVLFAVISALLTAGAAPAWAAFVDKRPTDAAAVELSDFEADTPWQAVANEPAGWQPQFIAVDADTLRTFRFGDQQVDLYVAFYAYQRQGAEVVNSRNSVEIAGMWQRAGSGNVTAMVDGHPTTVAYTRLLGRSGGRVVWHWYWVDGTFTSSPYIAKLLEIRAKLLAGTQAAAMIAVTADYTEHPSEATSALRAFLAKARSFQDALARSAS